MDDNIKIIARHIHPEDRPAAVVDALALEAAVAVATEKHREPPTFDLTKVTAANLTKTLEDAVKARTDHHDERLRVLADLARIAAERVEAAWSAAVIAAEATFAARFANATATMLDQLDALGDDAASALANQWDPRGAALREALSELDALSAVRDAYAHWSGTWREIGPSAQYEHESRLMAFEGQAAFDAYVRVMRSETHGHRFIAAARTPGVTLAWQTGTQQREQPWPKKVRDAQAAMLATAQSRSRSLVH